MFVLSAALISYVSYKAKVLYDLHYSKPIEANHRYLALGDVFPPNALSKYSDPSIGMTSVVYDYQFTITNLPPNSKILQRITRANIKLFALTNNIIQFKDFNILHTKLKNGSVLVIYQVTIPSFDGDNNEDCNTNHNELTHSKLIDARNYLIGSPVFDTYYRLSIDSLKGFEMVVSFSTQLKLKDNYYGFKCPLPYIITNTDIEYYFYH